MATKNNYTKYRVVYRKTKYICSNRRLSDDIQKARIFSSPKEAFDFCPHDINLGTAEVYAYDHGFCRRVVLPFPTKEFC